ncbi:Thioredoxin/protein disulfide isomerase [Ceraceosorus bombacis]|uniref:Thioredoxin/protein disulfide isomerase n=1 Tax=Ceraceosorus bombacis TaxID=401625 RepID=A0A0P1BCF3_9BASI|nr:Thioredoxin/protein disulfide isomerase [Ceraceosorus bombacis]
MLLRSMFSTWLLAAVLPAASFTSPVGTTTSLSAATHAGLLQLTASNWTESIKEGAWLIEFYSPYCSYCKTFLPTWDQLVSTKDHLRTDYPDAPFTLAQVDCNAQRDICAEQNVPHLPRLTVYRSGVQQAGEYQGDRDYTDLSVFIDKQASIFRALKGVSDTPHPHGKLANPAPIYVPPHPDRPRPPGIPQDQAAPPADPQKEAAPASPPKEGALDAQPAPPPPPPPPPPAPPAPPKEAASAPSGPNPEGVLLSFGKAPLATPKDLDEWLSKEGGRGSSFVKFFAPWCPHCKAMKPAFIKLAESLKGRVNAVEVDCEAYPLVCRTYRVGGFPTLRMYNEGTPTEYSGGRSHDAMLQWALKAGSTSGVRSIEGRELGELGRRDEVLFLYLHSPATPEREIDAVVRASRVLLTTPVHVYKSSDPQLLERYKARLTRGSTSAASSQAAKDAVSGLLVFKDHSTDRPVDAFYPSQIPVELDPAQAAKKVAEWLDSKRFATVTEITGATFSDVIHNKAAKRVVLAALSDLHHDGTTLGTGSGSAVRDGELLALKQLALAARTAPSDTDRGGNPGVPEVLFAWIDADRWASAIGKYYNIKETNLPALILADGRSLQYWNLPQRPIITRNVPLQAQLDAEQPTYVPGAKLGGSRPDTGSLASAGALVRNARNWIDYEAVLATLALISVGKGPKARSSRGFVDRGVRQAGGAVEALIEATAAHPLLSFAFLAALCASLALWLKRTARASSANRLGGKFD